MIHRHEIFEIHRLANEGLSVRGIAKTTSHSRKTITKYLRDPNPKRPIIKRTSKLNPFKDEIVRILRTAPNTSAIVIHKHLADLGFNGGISILRDYLRKIRGVPGKKTIFDEPCYLWMLKLLQGELSSDELEREFVGHLDSKDINTLLDAVLNQPLRYRRRAITVFAHCKNISQRSIARFLCLSRKTVGEYVKQFKTDGIDELLDLRRKELKKSENVKYIDAVFEILHAPPFSYDINRTTWRMDDLYRIMAEKGLGISKCNIRKIIKDAGYRFRKAKSVLTSNDPNYHEKLNMIKNILSSLSPKEKFFSVDEFGPFAVKMQGGKSLVSQGKPRTIPQWQKSKGSLILTAALELSSNQITHFYSKNKNTNEMLKLLDILLKKYVNEECIYLSWDAASWHISKKFSKEVEAINRSEYGKRNKIPIVKLAPLPTGAQFLNVIESVFSGMARAILHNSDYQSVDECKVAIDRYIIERNQYFRENPKRAGNKIWGKERVKPIFGESNNCKDPKWSKKW